MKAGINKSTINAVTVAFALFAIIALLAGSFTVSEMVFAEEDWKREFDDLCSRTEDSMTMETDALKVLVERCDRLKPQIEGLDETRRKVYLKKLQMCRDLYVFVLESREIK